MGQNHIALDLIRRALILQPNNAQAYSDLGSALTHTGQLDEAVAACRQAIALQPDNSQAHNNLGVALANKRLLDKAVAAFNHAIVLQPDFTQAYNNLRNVLADKGQPDEAIAAYRQALALNPNYAEAHSNLGTSLKDIGQLDQANDEFRIAIALNPNHSGFHSNLIYTMCFHPGCDARMIGEELRRWSRQHAQPLKKFIEPHFNDRDPRRRLKIGYVSSDFHDHPVWTISMLSSLTHHDKSQVEVFAYSQTLNLDAITQRLRSSTDCWHNIVGVPDAQVVDLIRHDQIDILVD